jgi:HEAT repeat protein
MSRFVRIGFAVIAIVSVVTGGAEVGHTEEPARDPSMEVLATDTAIKDAALRGAPITIWATLEHGERVECLDCLAYVEPLLFDRDARVREIAAWWIRKRIFGYAEIALKVRATVEKDADPVRRAAAAEAIGEFLDPGGTPYLVKAAKDGHAPVRAAAIKALQRMNDPDGAPVVAAALADAEVGVRKAAVEAATKVAGFRDVESVAKLLSDIDPVVRAKAADALGVFRVKGAVAGLSAIAVKDADEDVRIDAVNALGEIGDPAARPAIEAALNDSSSRVRDAARVASLKLATL